MPVAFSLACEKTFWEVPKKQQKRIFLRVLKRAFIKVRKKVFSQGTDKNILLRVLKTHFFSRLLKSSFHTLQKTPIILKSPKNNNFSSGIKHYFSGYWNVMKANFFTWCSIIIAFFCGDIIIHRSFPTISSIHFHRSAFKFKMLI